MVPSNLLELEVFWSGLTWYSDGDRPLLIRQLAPMLHPEVFPWYQIGLLRKESLPYYCHKNSLLLWAMQVRSPHHWSPGLLLYIHLRGGKARKKMKEGRNRVNLCYLFYWWNSPIASSSTDWLLLCCSGKLIMALYFSYCQQKWLEFIENCMNSLGAFIPDLGICLKVICDFSPPLILLMPIIITQD